MKKLPKVTSNQHSLSNETGTVPLLLLVAILGLLLYLFATNTFSFKDRLFSTLFPKPPSFASGAILLSGLKVSGNQIVNAENQTVRLYGVNRSGAEFACIQGWGIFDGPSDAPSIDAMKTWKINTVRIPLNEDCWLGINGVKPEFGGENYKTAILNYVNLLTSKGLAVILELHWSAPGTTPATGQQPMPDRDHTPTFWTSVANTFKGNSSVLFDLFNEPYPDSNQDSFAAWTCWRDGGSCPGINYLAAGMQEIINAVRSTGATNIIMLGGVQYSNSLSKWLEYKPSDPTGNLVASWHVYNFNLCNTQSCWDTQIAPIITQVPLVATEIGENTCSHTFVDPLMNWLDSKGAGYLGWTWNIWDCKNGPALITNYDGTPTIYGIGLKDHLTALATSPSSSPSPTPTPSPSSDYFVYDDYLKWDNWSWDTIVITNNPSPMYAGSYSLSAQYSSGHAGLSFHNPGFDTTPYSSLNFAIKLTSQALSTINASLYNSSDTIINWTNIASYATSVDTNGWYQISIPLTTLGGANTTITRVQLQEANNTSQPAFYIDNLRFIKTSSATPTPTPTPTPIPITTPTPTLSPITDTTKPTVSITNPLNGATIKANTKITIQSSASDNIGISKVEFYVSGSSTPKCTVTTSPYTCSWKVPAKKNVFYTITAKAYDTSNNSNSQSITVKAQ